MVVESTPVLSPAEIMKCMKGATSRVLREEFSELSAMPSLWTKNFFVSTDADIPQQEIEDFVNNQKSHPQGGFYMKTLYIDNKTCNIPESDLNDQDLKCILVEEDNPYFVSRNGILYSADYKQLIKVPAGLTTVYKTFDILDGVEEIANNAFYACQFNHIHFPKTLKRLDTKSLNGYIGKVDLSNSEALSCLEQESLLSFEDVVLPVHASILAKANSLPYISKQSVITIGENEVYDNDGTLLHVFGTDEVYKFPKQIRRVANKAFSSVLHDIKKIVINDELQSFWNPYIENFSNLQDVDVSESHPIFFKKNGGIYTRSKEDQKLVMVLHLEDGILNIPEGVCIIDAGACCRKTLKQINFPTTLHTINDHAFHRVTCERIDLKKTALRKVQHHAFELASISDSISFPKTLERIYPSVFAYSHCQAIDLEHTHVKVLPMHCFSYAYIGKILFPKELRTIETGCFDNVTFKNPELYLTQIDDGLKIEYNAFRECNLGIVFLGSKTNVLSQSFDANTRVAQIS